MDIFGAEVSEEHSDRQYAEIAVHEPLMQLYTYLVPSSMHDLRVGTIVEIPFGRRTSRGCVVKLVSTLPAELSSSKIKAIRSVITPGFYLDPLMISLALWISRYYLAPPGDCCSCVSFIGFNPISSQSVRRYLLTDLGFRVASGSYPARLGKKQRDVLEYLKATGSELISLNDLTRETGASVSTVQSLLSHGWVEELVQEVQRSDDYAKVQGSEEPLALSSEQALALKPILERLTWHESETFLLHGVTGSGKTEVYLHAIQKALELGGEAIVLVPEISLTPQTVDRFRRRFGNLVGVYHSRLTLGQKFDLWKDVVSGRVRIMIGARSALFTPFKNLKVIVVDEEHEGTYKQDSSPRYHARDIAIKRATNDKAVCILGSATPAIETYFKAKSKKFTLVNLDERIDGKPLPAVRVVDMTEEIREEGNPEFLSRALLKGMSEALSRKEQALLFLNRRGFFNFVICLQCHQAVKCVHCDVALTHHKISNKLICHYCGREYVVPKECPQTDCHASELNMIGLGTERLEDIVSATFPDSRVMRLDLDTTRKRNAFLEMWKTLEKGEVDIILGTQMIAKGLHLENVTVVGLPLADGAFYQPDFRATERAFSLMTQVAGRAGRGSKAGRVYLQTYVPRHYAVQYAQAHDYLGFYKKEIRVREVLRFPPFYKLFAILGTGKKDEETRDLIRRFSDLLKKYAHSLGDKVAILGPSPAPLSRINDMYRWRIIMRAKDQKLLREVLEKAQKEFHEVKGRSHIQVIVDVDPIDLL